jgi:hypothetical protein
MSMDQQQSIFGEQELDGETALQLQCVANNQLIKGTGSCPSRITEYRVLHLARTVSDILMIYVNRTNALFTLYVKSTDPVEVVKRQIDEVREIPPGEPKLIFAGRPLEDGNSLQDYSVPNKATLHLVIGLKV